MKHWHLWESKDGAQLELVEVPAWALVVSWLTELVDGATGHYLCCGGPSWAHKLPLGKPRYLAADDETILDNSLGAFIYDAFTWLFTLPDRRERSLVCIPVTQDIAQAARAS